ncbi:MAG: DUF3352 domain-containing protein, partial [Thermomicrobiales bacterium]|nr:DUF3352 domain-containing protein [Thermomicrobiales bacterium]
SLLATIDAPLGETLFTVAADDAGLRFESVSQPLESPLAPDTTIQDIPDFAASVPATTQAMVAGTDLGETWAIEQVQNLLLSYLASFIGGGEVDLSDIDAETQFGFLSMIAGFNVKTDLLDQLSGEYGVALFDVNPQNVFSSSAVIASELTDPDRVSVAVTSVGPLLQSVGSNTVSVTTSSVDGQTVNDISLNTGVVPTTFQYGVVDDQLMIGLGDGIETMAIPVTEALADTPAYQAALSELPAAYDGVLYIDLASIGAAFAPQLFDLIGSRVDNPLASCLIGAAAGTGATPVAVPRIEPADWIASTACSVFAGLFGGGEGIQHLLVDRIPGPLAAVGYHQDNVQHVSGI